MKNLQQLFEERYGRAPAGIVRAPGRVNLIGEHTDYNDGFVLPIAINRSTLAAWAPREGSTIRMASAQSDRPAVVDLATVSKGEPAWANYPRGVIAGLLGAGVKLGGADLFFDSDVPLGGGLSSSASLEVATALALLTAAGAKMDDRTLALLCQKAEHDFAGTPCGIMDQSIAIMGRAGHALLLDCRSGAVEQVPFDDPTKVLLVADTQVKHELSDGGYAARRDQCYAAAAMLGVKMLRDVTPAQIEKAAAAGTLQGKELRRARHAVGEIARTVEAVAALKAGDYSTFGKLMYASHESLAGDYDVSCEELDAIVASAAKCSGVYGARMTGGGFGGCAIILADAAAADAVCKKVADDFERQFTRRCPIFATHACTGAETVARASCP
ncbi:MAG: galactokinase [Planctomycetaceae bacterium]|nr:galactokinase [Planctomycetaceae bacterium]